MRVMLTGAAGFIGSHIARVLVREGCEVLALVRPGGRTERLDGLGSNLRVIEADLLGERGLVPGLQEMGPEVCIHTAWDVTPGRYLGAVSNVAWLSATLRLADTLLAGGCRRFVGLGTCFEYETECGYLSEASPLRPRSLYAAAKLATCMVLTQLARERGATFAWARLFYLYGPHEYSNRLVPDVLLRLLRGDRAPTTHGAQVRDYLHVGDVATAVWAVARSGIEGPVNIGSGVPITVLDLVSVIARLVGRPELLDIGVLPYGDGDPMFVCADNRRLTAETGWAPAYDLESGLRESIQWWRRRLSAPTLQVDSGRNR